MIKLVLEQQEAAGQRAVSVWRGLAGAAGKMFQRGRWRVLQRRGCALACSVCTETFVNSMRVQG